MDMDNAWENFLEAIAALLSKALTDKETEKVIAGFSNFQQRLQRLSRYEQLHSVSQQTYSPCVIVCSCTFVLTYPDPDLPLASLSLRQPQPAATEPRDYTEQQTRE